MVADVAAAEQFGPYLVYERLGVGGMATVHRALERGIEGFERIVALKRLLPHLAEDASFIKSFVREAKLASLLNHVNIVQIFELGRVGTEYFISMEYIDGRDIRRILRHARKVTGPPPIHVTTGLLIQLCEALDYAHAKVDDQGHHMGLVHRDVSPSNLLITHAGHLKVIDFGIAKAQSSQLRTQTGRVKGKLAYMAPEAVAGKDLDARSDLFAVGVIAHELLTARPLFASKNEYQTLIKVQRGDIMPPSTFNQACPAELDAIVLRALARDPNDRFSGAAELRDALHDLRRHYNLQTGHRDIAQWIDWAFSVEPPSGGFAASNTLDQTLTDNSQLDVRHAATKPRAPTPLPHRRRDDEEAAVDMAWGGGEAEHDAQPVVLDDVPDVSDKHLVGSLPAGARADELDDDIPPPQPSHGRVPARTRARSTAPPATPARPPAAPAAPASIDAAAPQRPTLPRVSPPATLPPRITSAGLAPRARTSSAPPLRARPPSHPPPAPAADADADAAATPAAAPSASPAETMRNLPSLPRSARVRAASVAPRDLPSLEPAEPAMRTRPGHEPARARALDPTEEIVRVDLDEPELLVTARRPRRTSTAAVTFGAAIVARQSTRKTWILVVALLIAGAAAAGAAIYVTRGRDKAPELTALQPKPAPVRTTGTVKFLTEPEDAEITVEGQPAHRGSPWSLELAAGVHQISIHRGGFKAWLTSLELSENETQTLRVVLEPLGGGIAASAEATLILSTTPPGLEVVLDGTPLQQRTPLRMPLKPGPHTIVVRQNGADVWRHQLDAQPSANYEFSPSMAEDKQRERERAGRTTPASGNRVAGARPAIIDGDRSARPPAGAKADLARSADRTVVKPESPTVPSIASIGQPALPPNIPPSGPPTGGSATPPPTPAITRPANPPPSPAAPSGPVLVAPTAVTRLGGTTPSVAKSKRGAVPPVVSAKVCIDLAGRVSDVEVLTKLERMTVIDLTSSLETWTYAPYKQHGAPVPACFVVSFRVK